MKLGFQPVNLTAQFFGNAVHPVGGSPWTMRLQIALLYPKFTKKREKEMMERKLEQMKARNKSNRAQLSEIPVVGSDIRSYIQEHCA
jgi:hypothetical protein